LIYILPSCEFYFLGGNAPDPPGLLPSDLRTSFLSCGNPQTPRVRFARDFVCFRHPAKPVPIILWTERKKARGGHGVSPQERRSERSEPGESGGRGGGFPRKENSYEGPSQASPRSLRRGGGHYSRKPRLSSSWGILPQTSRAQLRFRCLLMLYCSY
jgi:hypothetical protein